MKKVISAFLAALMLLGSLAMAVGAQPIVKDIGFALGNADGDEARTVNSKDLFMMKAYLLGNEDAVSDIDSEAADLAADGKINANDVFYMKKLLSANITLQELGDDKQTASFSIAGTDINEFKMVIPEGHDWLKNTHYSATQFNKYLKEATGVELEIVNAGQWDGPAINFYQYDLNSEEGMVLGTEGYSYDVTDGDLNIHGTYRGCMYAVWEILENYLGVRFFEDTYFYKQRYVNIEEGLSISFQPYFKFRFCGQNVGGSYDNAESYYYPSRQNGTQLYGFAEERYGYQYGPSNCNAHSFDLYWQMGTGTMPPDDGTMTLAERYAAKLASGEVQNNLGWQPCGTSESSYQTLFTGMIDHLRYLESWNSETYMYSTTVKHCVEAGQKSASFSACDNGNFCDCRYCRNKANGWTDRAQKPNVYYPPEGYSGVYLDMANRAAEELQEYYPGMRVHLIIYDHTVPATVRPNEYIILIYCGMNCNNHYINSDECVTGGQLGGTGNQDSVISLKAWGEICHEAGAEMWFWYYGVMYHYYLVDLPNLTNIYYDYKFLYEECYVSGIYFEGGGKSYVFADVRAYMSTKMEWNPTMSYEQYTEYMKEYLYMYYGEGYEYIYEFIMMNEEASDQCGTCYVSNYDRAGDIYSYSYVADNYLYMRELLQKAYDMADGKRADDKERKQERIKILQLCFDFLGLSSVHQSWYVEGDGESKALYEEIYTQFFNDFTEIGIEVYYTPQYKFPTELDLETNPMIQVYGFGSNRPGIYP